MRRQDRESMRGKSEDRTKGRRDDDAASESGRKQEDMRGGTTASESQKPAQPRPSGRLPLPE